ncbi:MAG: DNA polymerase IV [Clostridia bacterium]|nr:DNA polymerase IV [Clostridia bacterium]
MDRQILHIDVNNAFLSWTAVDMLKNGYEIDIRTIPAIIGGDESKRSGIVLAKSPVAKEFGVVTAETIYSAKKKCPRLEIFPANFKVYSYYSNKLYNLLLEYTEIIERFSIDECFLDMTNYLQGDTLLNKAKIISKRVKEELGFTVNIGVANNKLLAKMASDFEKPDKIHTLFKNEIPIKMWPLPVGELFMIGRKSVPKLNNMQIKTIGDIARTDINVLIKKFGKHGKLMWEFANGIDNSEVNNKIEKPKGVGNSVTLPVDISNKEKLSEILLSLADYVTYRLRKWNMIASTVNVQLRTKDFKDYSHQKKLYTATSSTKIIYETAKELLDEMYSGEPIRLVGLRVDNLTDKEERQITLFENEDIKKQDKLDKTLDELKKKYGYQSISRAGKMQVEAEFGDTSKKKLN